MVQGVHSQPLSLSMPRLRSLPGFAAMPTANAHLNPPAANSAAPQPQGLPQGLPQGHSASSTTSNDSTMQPPPTLGKRKAETQDNERLSKRLSLLNLERNGSKLYVPVETLPAAPTPQIDTQASLPAQESMQLDDSKHKVYIYNLDDELSSESEDEEGKLVFLSDIEKHLRETRIPQHILANRDGELAGMQLVLYSDPRSLSVPEEEDGVRKAIIEARQRARERQRLELEGGQASSEKALKGAHDDEMDLD